MLEISKLKLFLLFTVMIIIGALTLNHYRASVISSDTEQKVAEVTEKIMKPVNPEELKCLATNIYYEAGNEAYIGQIAVARVVMNRVAHGFASTPCKVIYQKTHVPDPDEPSIVKTICQFSWVCEGKALPNKLSARYKQAEDIARQVLSEDKWSEVLSKNVLFFHNTSVNPKWRYRRDIVIGNHVFYSK